MSWGRRQPALEDAGGGDQQDEKAGGCDPVGEEQAARSLIQPFEELIPGGFLVGKTLFGEGAGLPEHSPPGGEFVADSPAGNFI
jgi:hypothetical protein